MSRPWPSMRTTMRAALVALAVTGGGCANFAPPPAANLYQVSTLQALVEGVDDGVSPIGELHRYGDLGIGTFHALDGELVLVDGRIAQVKSDGTVVVPDPAITTPLACVIRFVPDRRIPVPPGISHAAFTAWLDVALGNLNLPYAVRLRGDFRQVRARSVPRQSKPYPRLVEVAATQAVFNLGPTRGSIVGFRLPAYFAGINLPGYHLHYLDEARTCGGHVLDFTLDDAVVEIQVVQGLILALPNSAEFAAANLAADQSAELHRAER